MTRAGVAMLIAGLGTFAQQPSFENARIETRAAGSNLEATLRSLVGAQAAPAWIGYAVPIVPGERQVCGWDGGQRQSRHMSLEGPAWLFVLYRAEQGKVDKVRIATPDCQIDAGGSQVIWLTGVAPDQSVRYLEGQVAAAIASNERIADSTVSGIALHNDASADRALDAMTAADRPESLRRKAAFWLGTARGRHGYERLTAIVRDDPSDKVREHAIFAMSQSKEKDAMPAIVKIAREDKSARVRGQALFWLAQRAEKKVAAGAIANAIESDPETDVKRKAVFALSRLPDGEGVTRLMEVARTNRNVEVRKQALFWLGQSKDPRALRFLEDLLAR